MQLSDLPGCEGLVRAVLDSLTVPPGSILTLEPAESGAMGGRLEGHLCGRRPALLKRPLDWTRDQLPALHGPGVLSVRLLRLAGPHDQHRAAGVDEDVARHAAEEEPLNAS